MQSSTAVTSAPPEAIRANYFLEGPKPQQLLPAPEATKANVSSAATTSAKSAAAAAETGKTVMTMPNYLDKLYNTHSPLDTGLSQLEQDYIRSRNMVNYIQTNLNKGKAELVYTTMSNRALLREGKSPKDISLLQDLIPHFESELKTANETMKRNQLELEKEILSSKKVQIEALKEEAKKAEEALRKALLSNNPLLADIYDKEMAECKKKIANLSKEIEGLEGKAVAKQAKPVPEMAQSKTTKAAEKSSGGNVAKTASHTGTGTGAKTATAVEKSDKSVTEAVSKMSTGGKVALVALCAAAALLGYQALKSTSHKNQPYQSA